MPVRPLTPDDAEAALAVADAALAPGEPPPPPERRAFLHDRLTHLAATDPGGAWVSHDDEGAVTGVALALVREGVWGLSLLAVAPSEHGRGTGRALLERALAHGQDAERTGRIILSSTHPAALRLYARAGLTLMPCVQACGVPDLSRAPDLAARVEEGAPEATEAISRRVRGASHARDLPVHLRHGGRLLVLEDRAFALIAPASGAVALLAGLDEEAATAVLWAAWAALGAGATVDVDFLTGGQQWAIAACLEAGLALSPSGAVFASGQAPLTPYLPSGAWL